MPKDDPYFLPWGFWPNNEWILPPIWRTRDRSCRQVQLNKTQWPFGWKLRRKWQKFLNINSLYFSLLLRAYRGNIRKVKDPCSDSCQPRYDGLRRCLYSLHETFLHVTFIRKNSRESFPRSPEYSESFKTLIQVVLLCTFSYRRLSLVPVR